MSEEVKPAMGDVLGNAGTPITITADGQIYKLAYPTPAAIDRIEKMIAAVFVAEVSSLADALPANEYADLRKDMREALAARAHRAGGSMWQRVMSEPHGATLYILSLFQHFHPTMTEADAIRIKRAASAEVDAALALVTPVFFDLLADRMGATPEQAQKEKQKFAAKLAAKSAAAGSNG